MRATWVSVLAIPLLTACGGDHSPTPPSGGSAPASAAVHGGNGQEAPAGQPVAVPPTVLVRNASGAPVAGVVVAFQVDSGGGSVSAPTATTDGTGVASAGQWQLGPAGPQVLSASVGSLPRVVFRATATGATGPAATVSVQAGDGFVAPPGQPTAASPAVAVRDANGRPVAGVVVVFSVDSGGGSVTAPAAVTDQAGIAAAGTWQLGPTEGPQVLRATADSLAPVTLRATARVTEVSLPPQTVSGAGGGVTLDLPGSPLNGLTITFPDGSLQMGTQVVLGVGSALGIVPPAGLAVRSPVLRIGAAMAELAQPARLRFPVTAADSSALVGVVMRYPGSGREVMLPPVSRDAASITVVLPSLGAGAAPAPAHAGRLAGLGLAVHQDEPILYQVAIDPSLLQRDFDSGFRPGVDDWDFRRQAIAALPFLLTGGAQQRGVDPGEAMVATSVWYFLNQRGSGTLNGRFQLEAGVPESNRAGLRWVALASRNIPDLFLDGALATQWESQISADAVRFARMQFAGIKATFLLSNDAPQPVMLFTSEADEAPRLGIAYRSVGNSIDIAVPDNPGATYRATFTEAGLAPFSVPAATGGAFVVRGIAGVPYATLVRPGDLSAQYPRVLAGTIGDAEGWPAVELRDVDGALDTAGVILLDPLRHWWECAECPDYGYRAPAIPNSPSRGQLFRRGALTGGSTTLGEMAGSALLSRDNLADDLEVVSGNAIYLPGPGSAGANAAAPGWLDWQTVRYRRMPMNPTPAAVVTFGDTLVQFVVAPVQAPEGTRYRWALRSPAGIDSVETTTPTHTRTVSGRQGGSMLVIAALDPQTGRPLGRDSVRIGEPEFIAWRGVTHDRLGIFSLLETDPWPGEPTPPQLHELATIWTGGLRAPDAFFYPRSAPGSSLEEIILVWAPVGAGSGVHEVPVSPGPLGPWVLATAPAGALLGRQGPISGSGTVDFRGLPLSYTFEATFVGRQMLVALELWSDVRDGFGNRRFTTLHWNIVAAPLVPPNQNLGTSSR